MPCFIENSADGLIRQRQIVLGIQMLQNTARKTEIASDLSIDTCSRFEQTALLPASGKSAASAPSSKPE
jgi:hypothetical protein